MNDDLTFDEIKEIKGNPIDNKDAILIVQQPDGNWRGFMVKNGTLVQTRKESPTTVLQLLITHE